MWSTHTKGHFYTIAVVPRYWLVSLSRYDMLSELSATIAISAWIQWQEFKTFFFNHVKREEEKTKYGPWTPPRFLKEKKIAFRLRIKKCLNGSRVKMVLYSDLTSRFFPFEILTKKMKKKKEKLNGSENSSVLCISLEKGLKNTFDSEQLPLLPILTIF